MDQGIIALFAFLLSLVRVYAVIVFAFYTLRFLDTRIDFKFSEWWVGADDNAKAIYLAARCFAVFVAVAICLG